MRTFYALQVKGQFGYVLMGQEGSVQICSSSQWPVRICSYGSSSVIWGSIRSKLGSAAFNSCGVRRDLKRIKREDLSERLGGGFHERNVICLSKRFCELEV